MSSRYEDMEIAKQVGPTEVIWLKESHKKLIEALRGFSYRVRLLDGLTPEIMTEIFLIDRLIDGFDKQKDLPRVGVSKWSEIERFVCISREKWRQLGIQGRAPKPIRMGARCTVYSNVEVHRWISDPQNYVAPQ